MLIIFVGETPVTPRKRKGASSDSDETPSKKKAAPKKKATPKPVKKTPSPTVEDEQLPDDAEDFIKAEQEWEQNFGFV